jgi:hypothetical protein
MVRLHHPTVASILALTAAAAALPPVDGVAAYRADEPNGRTFVAIEFADPVEPTELHAFATASNGSLAAPASAAENLAAGISLLLIDTFDPAQNVAWIGLHATTKDRSSWFSFDGEPAQFLAFESEPADSRKGVLVTAMRAQSFDWMELDLAAADGLGIDRAVFCFEGPFQDCDEDQIPDAFAITLGLAPDENLDGRIDWCGPAEDLNADGSVDAADLAILLDAWGTAGPGDLDGDGIVGATDLAALLSAW